MILEKEAIVPISEDEVPQKIRDAQNPPVVKVPRKEMDEQTERKLCSERFEKILESYRNDENVSLGLLVRYEEELPIFIEAVEVLDDKACRTACRKIVRACMIVSNYRVRNDRKRDWVCGTYISRVGEHFENWVRMVCLDDELIELINCFFNGKKLTQKQTDLVKVLLHNTPKTHVNRYTSELLDE